jgi:HD-GYP domain-containing protein (c-di-GMP phosphodiesterase class II)
MELELLVLNEESEILGAIDSSSLILIDSTFKNDFMKLVSKIREKEFLCRIILITNENTPDRIAYFIKEGVNDFLFTPLLKSELYGCLARNIRMSNNISAVFEKLSSCENIVRRRTTLLINILNQMVVTLNKIIGLKDPYTARHHIRVAALSFELGKRFKLPKKELEFLKLAGWIHDIGKLAIDLDVLNKSSGLNEEEYQLVKGHPKLGAKLIDNIPFNDVFKDQLCGIISQHHERLDGTGYPLQLVADEIHFYAQIVAVADVFDAMVSFRNYRPSWKKEATISYLIENSTKEKNKFNRKVVEQLKRVLLDYEGKSMEEFFDILQGNLPLSY